MNSLEAKVVILGAQGNIFLLGSMMILFLLLYLGMEWDGANVRRCWKDESCRSICRE